MTCSESTESQTPTPVVTEHGLVTLPTSVKIDQVNDFLTYHQMISVHLHDSALKLEIVALSLLGCDLGKLGLGRGQARQSEGGAYR
jgi:hypothetical protein